MIKNIVTASLVLVLLNSLLLVNLGTVFDVNAQNSVELISSSATEFKIGMNNFIFHFRDLGESLEDGTYRAVSVVYHNDYVNYCLGTLGQHGLGFNYFQYATGVKSTDEDQEKIVATVQGKRSGKWNYTVYFTFFKEHAGLVRMRIQTNFRFKNFLGQGGSPQFWAVTQDDKLVSSVYGGSSGWYSVLGSAARRSPPLVVGMREQGGNYLFSTTWLELSGRDSIFRKLEDIFGFQINTNSFGLETPNSGIITLGTYVSGDYIFYVWRNPSSPEAGLIPFLEAITSILGQEITEADYENAIAMAARVILSISKPKSVDDMYVVEDSGHYLTAYVGDSRQHTKESTEFISHVNVLLGAAYYYNRTKDPLALELCRNILSNISNFDVFYLDQYGFYSNNWAPGKLDLWYIITNPSMLMGAHTLAPDAVPLDGTKLKAHANWLIEFARKRDYVFSIFANPDGTVIGSGTEPDAALGYSYFMMKLYELYGNTTHLEEAKTSLSKYMQNLYGNLYEAHLTAMGLAASSKIYKYTNDTTYLSYLGKLSYQFSRWINFHRGLWVEKNVPFALISAMPNIYLAAFEYGLAKLFIEEAAEIGNPELEAVYKFYTRFTPYTSKYAFPEPLGITTKLADSGIIDADYWIPIEDIYPSYEEAEMGRIGQEIYGAGSQIIALMPVELYYDYTPTTAIVTLPKKVFTPDENATLEITVGTNSSTTLRIQYQVYKNDNLTRSDSVDMEIQYSGVYNLTIGKYNEGNYTANVTVAELPTQEILHTTLLDFTVEQAALKPTIPILTLVIVGAIVATIIVIVGWKLRRKTRTVVSSEVSSSLTNFSQKHTSFPPIRLIF